MLRTFGNVRNFPRRLFEFLTVILVETRATRESISVLDYHLDTAKTNAGTAHELRRIGEMMAANSQLSKRMVSGSAALHDFCDQAAQLLLQQQRQIETLLTANKLLMERAQATGQLVERLIPAVERRLQPLNATLDGQDRRLFAIEEAVKAQATVMPSWHATPEAAAEIRGVLRLLTPRTAANTAMHRFGRDFDGGYVMPEDFKGAGVAISLGINDDVSWDFDVAQRGLEVFQFDHTIATLPQWHERFHFKPLRIAAAPADGAVTLEQAFRLADATGTSQVILKMDIEGDEWEVLDAVPPEILERCNQIAVEFHHMERLVEPESLARAKRVFEKLTARFFLCHVHGNNCGNLVNVHNIVLPETLEMSFAKIDLYQPVDRGDVFPQELDMPNQPGRADFFLGAFKF